MKAGGVLLLGTVVLLLVHLPSVFAYGLVTEEKVCGIDHILYFSFDEEELFYINWLCVDKELFCDKLQFFYSNGCHIQPDLKISCRLSRPSDVSSLKSSREFLRRDIEKHNNTEQNDGEDNESIVIPEGITIAAPGFFLLCCCFLFPCFRARNKDTEAAVLVRHPSSTVDPISSMEMSTERAPSSPLRVPQSPRFSMSPNLSRHGSIKLDYEQIAKATHHFSSSHKIGEGGFGSVYKAQLQNGLTVAVKRAKREHFESMRNEFSNEVELLSKIDHRNLVRLIGYVDQGDERLIIMEYVPNGTLRDHLDGRRGKVLDFNQRLEIAIDITHALTYLHLYAEKQIIHRDVKSSNILLTESFRAKVADFGFAKLSAAETEATHVSTKVKGTVGYMDPEYMRTYQLSTKSDVYSFGVLLIEILTGRRPVDLKKPQAERVTLRWAFKKYIAGNDGVLEMVDPMMQEVIEVKVLDKLFGLAIQCAAPIRSDRPDMKIVGEELWAIRMDYHKSQVRRQTQARN
uniref:non-specific serine/threonine protein kinase n=1 Tax=Kalanchoe fedtschenkoi TaxID=63787 RepID=A0A7N1A7J7_KALFE